MCYNILRSTKGVIPMKKSVYSIVLMDDVIRAVDEQAYRLGTSRSNLINQILAAHLSCVTPEMRMQKIFSSISQMINSRFQVQQQRSDSLMTLRSALEYKYRPTINYRVELVRAPDNYIGTLRVHIRTQSSTLISLFSNFFNWWADFELWILNGTDCPDYSCELSPGCFTRKLIYCERSAEETGEAIYSYIELLDRTIRLYFSAPQSFSQETPVVEREYRKLLERTII